MHLYLLEAQIISCSFFYLRCNALREVWGQGCIDQNQSIKLTHILSNSKWCNAIDQQEDKTISILSFGTSQSIKKGTETTIIPVKHAQWVAFLQQFINISLMQCPGYNKDNIINHMPVPVKSIILWESNYCTRAGNMNKCTGKLFKGSTQTILGHLRYILQECR